MAYGKLDDPKSDVRVRLKSTVVRVEHEGEPRHAERVRVAYRRDGKTCSVRARHVILACYNTLIPSLVPELPGRAEGRARVLRQSADDVQQRADPPLDRVREAGRLEHLGAGHVPHELRTRSGHVDWRLSRRDDGRGADHRAVRAQSQQAGPSEARAEPGGTAGAAVDVVRAIRARDSASARARCSAAAASIPSADIVGITVNRWPHGYAYTYDTLGDPDVPPEQRPHVVGRQRFGRIAIANCGCRSGRVHQPGDRRSQPRRRGAVRGRRSGLIATAKTTPSRVRTPAALQVMKAKSR